MGTQQILLIVLSVIIVGAAIAVGIQMFNSQAYSANKSAIAADAQSFATQVVQYYKTPESQGGAGGVFVTGTDANVVGNVISIGKYIGWGDDSETPDYTKVSTDSGDFTLEVVSATSVTITGVGKEEKGGKNPNVVTTITLPAGTIQAVTSDVAVE